MKQRRGLIGLAAVALIALFVIGVPRLRRCSREPAHASPSRAGDPCRSDSDCHPPFPICVQLRDTASYCSTYCREDADCPASMSCDVVLLHYGVGHNLCGR